jgi:ribosomal protein S18 acetylase RimI-like enzyme
VSTRAWVAEPHDAETVARLLIEFRDWYGRDWPSDNAFLAGVERLIERQDTEYLLATPDDDSPPAGVCQLRYRWGIWLAAEDCWLEDLYVREDARRDGVGSALLELAVARALERGCRRVELDVAHSNVAAKALYERHGFSTEYKPPAPNVVMGLRLEDEPE